MIAFLIGACLFCALMCVVAPPRRQVIWGGLAILLGFIAVGSMEGQDRLQEQHSATTTVQP